MNFELLNQMTVGTKQIRISKPEQIRIRIEEFQGKKINIVLQDGNVFLGTLRSVSDTEITMMNMRQKEVSFLLTNVNEIYFDTRG